MLCLPYGRRCRWDGLGRVRRRAGGGVHVFGDLLDHGPRFGESIGVLERPIQLLRGSGDFGGGVAEPGTESFEVGG